VDGVGLGADDPAVNPLVAADTPALTRLLAGRRPVRDAAFRDGLTALAGLDATLGVDGVPQSGTGHTALLTGENAVRSFGRHYGPWVPTALRPVVMERGLLRRAVDRGVATAFANAYPEEAVALVKRGVQDRRLGPLRAGPPLAALGAGLLDRHTDALERGDAVASEIVNDGWRERLGRGFLPAITARDAGRNLAAIAAVHTLTLFAHYSTDYVGHRGSFQEAVAVVERLDAFLGGVLDALPTGTLLMVVSDHGNIEDVRVEHTRNEALALLHGPGAADLAGRLRDLTHVAPALLGVVAQAT